MKIHSKSLMNIFCGTVTAITLAACSTPSASTGPTVFSNKIQVAESIERLELYTRPNGLDLSARDKLAVSQFLQIYRQKGNGPIYLNIPSNAANGLGVQQAQTLIRQNLRGLGLGNVAMQSGQYQAAYGSPAPVVVSYRRLKTVPTDCRQLGDISDTYANQTYDNFGCFHSANLAAMIDDPRQLLEPYELTVPDAQRRQTVYDNYIEGQNTATPQPDRQEITVN